MNELNIQPVFPCPICGRIWETVKLAQECLDLGFEQVSVQPGDIVLIGGHRYGWYDGDPAWVSEDTVAERNMKLFALYYVVTSIEYPPSRRAFFSSGMIAWSQSGDYKDHRAQIHVETAAMTGEQGHRRGYTYTSGHFSYTKINRPDLKELGKQFIGNVAPSLL